MSDLWAALCLVAVLEGLFLFSAPKLWKQMAAQMLESPEQRLRSVGAVMVLGGLLALWAVRG